MSEQYNRLERQYANNPRAKYRGALGKAYKNAVTAALSRQGAAGRFVMDSSMARDYNYTPGDSGVSAGNAVQNLYGMARLGNKTAQRLLDTKVDTRTLTASKGASNG